MSSSAPHVVSGGGAASAHVLQLIDQVELKLHGGEIASALALLQRHATESPWIRNAIGVCRLREDQPRAAQMIFQDLATDGGFLRQDVPPIFCLNLAVARLLQRNFIGFEAAMKVIKISRCPAATKYLSCYRTWLKSHTLGQRLWFTFTRESERPFSFDFPPGELR